jgi:putative salt-induced outer membrane protein YdiY
MVYLVLLLSLQVDPTLHERFLELERGVLSGLHERDAVRLDVLLDDDYILRGRPDIGRATWIRNAVTLCWGNRSEIEEFSAREADGAVVTSFVLTLFQDPITCEPATIRSLVTDVWTGQDGIWRLSVRHSGPISTANEDPIAQQFLREEPPPPLWGGAAELSFISTGGNAKVQTIGASSQIFYRPGVWETAATGAFVRSIADGVESARSLTAQVRQSAQIRSRIDVFGRSGYVRDLFAGIDRRWTADAGLGYQVFDTGAHGLKVDGGIGYLTESRTVGPSRNSAIVNAVKTLRWQIANPVVFVNEAMVTTLLAGTQDWRLNNQLSLTTSLTDIFSIKLSFATNYLHQPVSGFGRTTTIVSVALVAKFEKR